MREDVDKSKILVVGSEGVAPKVEIEIIGKLMDVVNSLKYLGVVSVNMECYERT